MILENWVLRNHEDKELDPCLADRDPYHVKMHADDQQALGDQLDDQFHGEAEEAWVDQLDGQSHEEEEDVQKATCDFLAYIKEEGVSLGTVAQVVVHQNLEECSSLG